jgi:hypothetical protein
VCGAFVVRVVTSISDQRQCVLAESLSYAPTSGGSSRGRCLVVGIVSVGKKRSNQNWHGPGESDCLIKTKHCDGRRSVLTQCDFCPVR